MKRKAKKAMLAEIGRNVQPDPEFTAPFIRGLFDPPDAVRGGDFVLRLAEGLERPEQALRSATGTAQRAIPTRVERAVCHLAVRPAHVKLHQ